MSCCLMVTACVSVPVAIVQRDGSVLSGELNHDLNMGFKVSNGKVSCEGGHEGTSGTLDLRIKVTCSDGRSGVALVPPNILEGQQSGTLTFEDGTKANLFYGRIANLAAATPLAYSEQLRTTDVVEPSNQQSGYLVFSLLRDKKNPLGSQSYQGSVSAFYSNAGQGKERASYCSSDFIDLFGASKDIDNAEGDGTVYVKALPPGTYAFYDVAVSTGCGSPETVFYEGVNFPFTIKPGRVTYAGEFHFLAHLTINYFSRSEGAIGVVATDQSARDLPIARAKAKLPLSDVDLAVPIAAR